VTPTLTQIHAGSTIGGCCKPSRQSDPGRVCAFDGCTTRLSTYNHTDFCGVHESIAMEEAALAAADAVLPAVQRARDLALQLLREAAPGEWVVRPDGVHKATWNDAMRALKSSGWQIEGNRGGRPGHRLVSREETDGMRTDDRVWGLLASYEPVTKPEDMTNSAWTASIFRHRHRGHKIKASGAGQYRLLRPGEKLTPQDELDRRQARRKVQRSTETATGTQAPQEASTCVSEHVAVRAEEVDEELLVMAELGRLASPARRRVLEWAASRFSDERESA
jgi:hypothetical protein